MRINNMKVNGDKSPEDGDNKEFTVVDIDCYMFESDGTPILQILLGFDGKIFIKLLPLVNNLNCKKYLKEFFRSVGVCAADEVDKETVQCAIGQKGICNVHRFIDCNGEPDFEISFIDQDQRLELEYPLY